jgi:hypothetical protein
MSCRTVIAALILALCLSAQPRAETPPDSPEVARLRALVEAGVLAPAELSKAQQAVEKVQLESTVRRLLQQPDLLPAQITELLRSVTALQTIEREALRRQLDLIEAGAVATNSLVPFRDRLEFVDQQVQFAQTRARLVRERSTIASAEDRLDELIEEELAFRSAGASGEWDDNIVEIDAFYYEEFGVGLPISAAGSTDLHVSMGFDHSGRYDVALHPDEFEGLFLMSLLEEWDIPYIAFKSAVPGQATGPHIHIGPPSLRIDPDTYQDQLDQLDELLGGATDATTASPSVRE